MNFTLKPTIRTNLPVPSPPRQNYGTLKTNNTTPYNNLNTNYSKNNNFNNNSNNNFNNAVSIPLNLFTPNWRPEVPKGNEKFRTPNRLTRNPFGKVGELPGQAPPRRQTRKLTRRHKQSRRRHHRR